jgi:predicted transcriptional regulator
MPYATRLEEFIKSRGIKPAHLAKKSEFSRQHLLRIRMGRMEPTRRCIAAVLGACSHLSGETLRADDLFDFGERVLPPPDGRDAIATLFYRILSKLGAPVDFFVASLSPARTTDLAREALEKISRGRVKTALDSVSIVDGLDAETQRTLILMLNRLRRSILEVNVRKRDEQT